MGKYLLGGLFLVLLALNAGAYVYFVNEIDGSTLKSTKTLAPTQQPDRGAPTR